MKQKEFETHIKSSEINICPILGGKYDLTDFVKVDLSVNNSELKIVDTTSADALGEYLRGVITHGGFSVGYGGYLEHRNLYERSGYFGVAKDEDARNIHLGVDLWLEAHSSIYAPISGSIHSFKVNKNHGDYGPTIIMCHKLKDLEFYTLYGHLSTESLKGLEVGMEFKCGEKIAELGTPEENGNYAPHLHFQVILNLQGNQGDYPGVSSAKDLEFYKNNCPDPALLLGLS